MRFPEEGYVIAGTDDLVAREEMVDRGSGGVTQAEAVRILEAHLAEHPEDRGRLQVVPTYEVAQ